MIANMSMTARNCLLLFPHEHELYSGMISIALITQLPTDCILARETRSASARRHLPLLTSKQVKEHMQQSSRFVLILVCGVAQRYPTGQIKDYQ